MNRLHAAWVAVALLGACTRGDAPATSAGAAPADPPTAGATPTAPPNGAGTAAQAGAPAAAGTGAEAVEEPPPDPGAPPTDPPPVALPHGTVVEQKAVPAPPPSSEPAQPDTGRPKRCEVEMTGAIELPPRTHKPDGDYIVYVADGDCLADDAWIFQRVKVAEQGTFFVEEFPLCGAPMTLCGSIESEEGKPTRWYGKLDRLIDDKGGGEVYVPNLVIPIKKGAPHTFPPRRPSGSKR